jgi:type VI protein secretion system component VasF
MKNVWAILAGAVVIAIALFFGLRSMQSNKATPPPPPYSPIDTGREIEIALNKMDALLTDAKIIYQSIEEKLSKNDYSDIAKHASEIEQLSQEIRKAGVVLTSGEFKLIKRDISDIQHTAHELQEAAEEDKHQEVHHNARTLKRYLDTLEKDLKDLM